MTAPDPSPARRRLRRRRSVEELASEQDGVVSRSQVLTSGITRAEIRANVEAGRWARVSPQALCVHRGPLTVLGRLFAAVFEAGPRALVDGEWALVAAGLEHYEPGPIRVSVPRGAKVRRVQGVDVRQTRRWASDDAAGTRLPRTRAEVAAVRAALWARSNRQAALLLTMAVQQGLCGAEDIALEMLRIRRDKRRSLLNGVVLDLLGGVRSLGELDVVRGCRDRGLPEPEKQALFRARNGKYYLDFRWPQWGVVVEVDGIQHAWATQVVGDALRQNALAMSGDVVLRLPLLGLRVAPDDFFGQIREALQRAGWTGWAA